MNDLVFDLLVGSLIVAVVTISLGILLALGNIDDEEMDTHRKFCDAFNVGGRK